MLAAEAGRMNVFFTDAKDGLGYASWSTTAFPTFTAFAPGDGAVERVVKDARARGMQVAARFDMFEDGVASQKFPSRALGASWVDPACPEVQANLIAMVTDFVKRVPVDVINFDHVRYPYTNEVSGTKALPCTGGTLGSPTSDRSAIIAAFVKDAAAAARDARPGIRVSASIFPDSLAGPNKIIGQDAAKIAPHVDVLMPMAYPSYWLGSTDAPYKSVYENTRIGVQKFGSAKIQPWIQGFGIYAGNTARVCDQVKAARDAGASGVFVWWLPEMGNSQTMWKSLGDCAAASAPVPNPAPFSATFTPTGSNAWWVQVKVSSSSSPSAVEARVNGGPWQSLTLRSWGDWAASISAPAGSIVQFIARDANGAFVTSGCYQWTSRSPTGCASAPAPTLAASFAPTGSNAWWVQVKVSSSSPLASVNARVNGGAWQSLSLRSWGDWANSIPAPSGSVVQFEARSTAGGVATSGCYQWTTRAPVACS